MNEPFERLEEKRASDQRIADPEQELDRLVRLQGSDDPGEHAEHAALGAARCELGRRRLGEEAAVARPIVRLEDRHLAVEAVDRAVDDRDVVPDRRVVEEVPGREVVGTVDDHVPAVPEDPVDVLGVETLLIRDDVDVGVDALERLLRGEHLRLAERCRRVDDLALEVRRVDGVRVDDAERADACRCEVQSGRRAEPAGAEKQNARVEQLELSRLADLRDQDVAAVAGALLGLK